MDNTLLVTIFVVLAMVVVGLIIGWLAGIIFKQERPYGLAGDLGIAVACTVIIGMIAWYVIPAMEFTDTIKYIGLIFEPALGALLVLWLLRRAKQ